MSSSIQYVIKRSRNISHRGYSDAEESSSGYGGISVGVVFSIVYIGIASNFYAHLTSVDNAVGENFSRIYTTDLEPNFKHFCENIISWKVCAILGIVVCGVLYLFLGCISLWIVRHAGTENRFTCEHLWEAYDFITKLAAVVIFYILLKSDAHHLKIGDATGFQTAALIFLVVVGIETAVYLLALNILLICGLCYCSVLLFR